MNKRLNRIDTKVSLLHNKAMAMADAAVAQKLINPEKSIALFIEALEFEKEAAGLLFNQFENEPTRSILFRSAANLALDSDNPREAEKLIAAALIGNPPNEIVEELRDLLESVNFQRHMQLKGVKLYPNEVQIAISGNEIDFGIAPTNEVFSRISGFEKLVLRTAERQNGTQYRDKGKINSSVLGLSQSYLSIPRAASYAITLRFGSQSALFDTTQEAKAIDEAIKCIEVINTGDFEKLSEIINDRTYLTNFLGIAKQIAPDGDKVKTVGITTIRNNVERHTPILSKKREINIDHLEEKSEIKKGTEIVEIKGFLEYANSTSKSKNSIKIIDEKEIQHPVEVPEGLMNDIVRPFYGKYVCVTAVKKTEKKYELRDIYELVD
jgi:hypothetical protein